MNCLFSCFQWHLLSHLKISMPKTELQNSSPKVHSSQYSLSQLMAIQSIMMFELKTLVSSLTPFLSLHSVGFSKPYWFYLYSISQFPTIYCNSMKKVLWGLSIQLQMTHKLQSLTHRMGSRKLCLSPAPLSIVGWTPDQR